MKYEKEVNEILTIICPKEKWMTDDVYSNILFMSGIDKQEVHSLLEKGIANGYTVEDQIKIIKKSI